jgi:hypothetical protein
MSDEPTPELRALADALFAAGRAEQPEPALGRRLQLIDPRLAQRAPAMAPGPFAPLATRGERPRRALGIAGWFAVAALLAGGVGSWLFLPSDDPIQISAERAASERAAQPPVAQPPVAQPPVAQPPVAQPSADPEPRVAARRPLVRERAPKLPSASDSTRRAAAPLQPKLDNPSAPHAKPSTLRAELELLAQARSALRAGDAARALELLDRHDRERSGGELVAEATLLRIEALSVRGEPRAASELAARFVRDNPHSALSDRAKTFIRAQPARP